MTTQDFQCRTVGRYAKITIQQRVTLLKHCYYFLHQILHDSKTLKPFYYDHKPQNMANKTPNIIKGHKNTSNQFHLPIKTLTLYVSTNNIADLNQTQTQQVVQQHQKYCNDNTIKL